MPICSKRRPRLASWFGAAFGLVLTAASADAAAQPPNLGDLKVDILAYQQYGGYERDLATVASQAQAYLDTHLANVAKPAMVFDIDETSLSNWTEIKANDFAFLPDGECAHLPDGPCGVLAWNRQGKAPPIAPILALFKDGKSRHVAIFFITGRHEAERAATERNLAGAGYSDWDGLYMEPDSLHPQSAADFKAPERAKIEARGYHIIVNIGDQPSDLAGGHAERAFLLPNPFYRLP
jgi:predicted secreted acid phosphatase